jgi:MSHA biogenesis protein MshJ
MGGLLMKAKFVQLINQFDQLELRTRLLLAFCAIIVLGLLIDLLFISTSQQEAKKLQLSITQNQQTLNELAASQKQLNAAFLNQRDHPIKRNINQLEQQIKQLKSKLETKTSSLIPPESMASVLREIISRSKDLKLIALTKQAPIALFNQKDEDAALAENTELAKNYDASAADPTTKDHEVKMYRHLVEIELVGNYQSTQSFLKQIEQMPQKVKFESFDYQVEDYPKAKINLVVSTLSFNKKWIGG